MNNYQIVYKIRRITSFASYSLKAKHITSRQALELTIQNSFPTYTKLHHDPINNELHHNSKLENGRNF
jgi:hypothetical protein